MGGLPARFAFLKRVLVSRSPVGGRGLGRVDEDVVFSQLPNVLFNLLHLFLEVDLPGGLAHRVQFAVVGFFLVLLVPVLYRVPLEHLLLLGRETSVGYRFLLLLLL